MASCPQCMEVVSLEDSFCGGCGLKLHFSDSCQTCGRKFNATERFCGKDGTPRVGLPPNGTLPNHFPQMDNPGRPFFSSSPAKQRPTKPAVHQLVKQEPMKQKTHPNQLLRPPTKPYNILVIGQTGSGKSTFVNMVCNYFRNGTVTQPRVLIATKYCSSTESDSQKCEYSQQSFFSTVTAWVTGVSQTLRPVTYKFQNKDTGCMFNIIDTPGLGDTRGIVYDEKNIEGILAAASELEYLDSICIVANGSMAKLDPGLKMVLERFRANLPNSVRKNSVLILTNCEELSANVDVDLVQKYLLGDFQDKIDVFHMNNSVFSTDPKKWDAKSIERELKPSWNESMETIASVFERISSRTEVSTQDFKEMKIIRGKIKTEMAAVMNCIKNGDALRKRIVDFEAKSQNCANNALKYADFKRTETFEVDVQEATSNNNVVCNTCKVNCHQNCRCWYGCICYTESYIPFFFSTPECMKCKCTDAHHSFAKCRWKKETRSVERVMSSVKERFDDLRSQAAQMLTDKTECERDLIILQKSSDFSMEKLKSLAESLKRLCDGINLAQEVQATIDCWKKELEIEQNPQTRRDIQKRIEEMRSFIQTINASESNPSTKTTSTKQYSQKVTGINCFIKNLAKDVTDSMLRDEFRQFGAISSCTVMKTEEGASKGFGFVCYTKPEDANRAVAEMNGKLVFGKSIYVALAQPKAVRQAELVAQHQYDAPNGNRNPGGARGMS